MSVATFSLQRAARHNVLASTGVVLVTIFVSCALFAPWIAPQDPAHIDLPTRLAGPSSSHWCGTDELGRDILSRLIYGSRISILVGSCVVAASLALGLIVGSIAFDDLDLPSGEHRDIPGGAATYSALAASLLTHGDVSVVGVVGDDFPDAILAELKTRGIDASGVQRRMDYVTEVNGSALIGHYTSRYKTFDGLVVATRRRVFRRNPDNTVNLNLPSITLDVHDVELVRSGGAKEQS